ncbi:hypothetical protein GALMADRAFT_207530 [Galerina marginata CBS 339.88]|uniref:Uncharacterized protein n=1 Tax=Galerina marginata (strain CBS 339.88) TaxID=685588 RepID=A0A067TQP3_GALM3|nr:hypothetical protein GALMADRAFT_207530 [Galerina marginata CBS 339.88]
MSILDQSNSDEETQVQPIFPNTTPSKLAQPSPTSEQSIEHPSDDYRLLPVPESVRRNRNNMSSFSGNSNPPGYTAPPLPSSPTAFTAQPSSSSILDPPHHDHEAPSNTVNNAPTSIQPPIPIYYQHPNPPVIPPIFPSAPPPAGLGIASMPMPGSHKAPKKFKGSYSAIRSFLNHLDRLYAQCQITRGFDKVNAILDYCSQPVHSFIQTTAEYSSNDWNRLKDRLLIAFDAERDDPIYTIADVIDFVRNSHRKPIKSLAKWRKYERKFQTIAGSVQKKGRLADREYCGYFWTGMPSELKEALKPMLLIEHRQHDPYRTYPNNIPLPQNQFGGFPQLRDNKCFGCFDPNHYLSNCPRMRELFQQGIVEYDPVTKKYCMKKTREVINRSPRETMYEAALRLNSVMPPAQPQNANYVTFAPEEGQEDTGTLEDSIQQYYASQLNNETETDSDDSDDEGPYWKYALHAEKQQRYYQPSSDYYDSESEDENNAVAYPVTRSMAKRTAEARERANKLPSKPPKMVFDGVYPPRRPRGPPKPKPESAPAPEVPQQTIQQLPTPAPQQAIQPTTISALPQTVSQAPESSRQAVPVPAPSRQIPAQKPLDTRRLRINQDMPMDVDNEPTPARISRTLPKDIPPHMPANKENAGRGLARQSEISREIDTREVVKEILDTQITIPIRKIIGSSREIATDLQDILKFKNSKPPSALTSISPTPLPIVANAEPSPDRRPLPEGRLIRINLQHGDKSVKAIIDTGSELSLVRCGVADRLQLPVDVTRHTLVNDANGGQSKLTGLAERVRLQCGRITTIGDIWVGGENLPFDLLLGRPWQRENLVSIDEQPSGSFIVFKDPTTSKSRFKIYVGEETCASQATNQHFLEKGQLTGIQSYALISEGPPEINSLIFEASITGKELKIQELDNIEALRIAISESFNFSEVRTVPRPIQESEITLARTPSNTPASTQEINKNILVDSWPFDMDQSAPQGDPSALSSDPSTRSTDPSAKSREPTTRSSDPSAKSKDQSPDWEGTPLSEQIKGFLPNSDDNKPPEISPEDHEATETNGDDSENDKENIPPVKSKFSTPNLSATGAGDSLEVFEKAAEKMKDNEKEINKILTERNKRPGRKREPLGTLFPRKLASQDNSRASGMPTSNERLVFSSPLEPLYPAAMTISSSQARIMSLDRNPQDPTDMAAFLDFPGAVITYYRDGEFMTAEANVHGCAHYHAEDPRLPDIAKQQFISDAEDDGSELGPEDGAPAASHAQPPVSELDVLAAVAASESERPTSKSGSTTVESENVNASRLSPSSLTVLPSQYLCIPSVERHVPETDVNVTARHFALGCEDETPPPRIYATLGNLASINPPLPLIPIWEWIAGQQLQDDPGPVRPIDLLKEPKFHYFSLTECHDMPTVFIGQSYNI